MLSDMVPHKEIRKITFISPADPVNDQGDVSEGQLLHNYCVPIRIIEIIFP